MQELLADAKSRPGQITFGATLGSTTHFFPAMIEKAAGVKWKYVSYEGTSLRMTALLGGHIDLGESNLTQADKARGGPAPLPRSRERGAACRDPRRPDARGARDRRRLRHEPRLPGAEGDA